MSLKNDIIAALTAATEPLDRTAISSLCLSGTNEQIADQLYLLKKAKTIIGEKQRGGSFLYRMPNADEGDVLRRAVDSMIDVGDKTDANSAVLSMRGEAEVDEIDLARIEEAAEIIRMVEEISDEPKKLPPRDVIERMIAEKPGDVEVPSDDVLEAPAENVKQYINVWPGPTLAERMADPKGTKPGSQLESAERSVPKADPIEEATKLSFEPWLDMELERIARERAREYDALEAANPINGSVHVDEQPESAVEEIDENGNRVKPIKQEDVVTQEEQGLEPLTATPQSPPSPPKTSLQIALFSDSDSMYLMRDADRAFAFAIDQDDLCEIVRFGRRVGWIT